MPDALPIYEIESRLLEDLRSHRRVILSAPTGSGKSTQVPQMLLRNGFLDKGEAVILQPRRLATRLLAARVAEETRSPLGGTVGYQIRFENVTSPETKVRFITEGVLLRQMVQDPLLSKVSVLVFDEFHERHLYGDISLARALDLQDSSRPDLIIIVMSATLDLPGLERYLFPCRVLSSTGRTFPVEIRHLPPGNRHRDIPPWELAAESFSEFVATGGEGDVLIFMPGGFEIHQTLEAIRRTPESKGFLLLPLHGELPPHEQDAAVARYPQRKVVVATNVAETSLTIDGVRAVIDSGLARIPKYDPHRGINTLLIEKISRASSDQRAGRAGRTAPGVSFRLWTEKEHLERPVQELPEIRRLDLSEVILTLKAAGVEDLRKFRWLEPPDERSLAQAEELLSDLGALDPAGRITSVGRKMLAFPVHPRYARMLLAAEEFGCVYQACLIAALTQGRDLLLRNVDRQTQSAREDLLGDSSQSDFWILIRAWNFAAKNQFSLGACRRLGIHAVTARQVKPLLDQFLRIAEKEGLSTAPTPAPDEQIRKCILSGFSDRLARRVDSGSLRCEITHHRKGLLARDSAVQNSPLFVTAEIREIESKDRELNTLLTLATAVEESWLREMFPGEFVEKNRVWFDAASKRVMAETQVVFRELVLSQKKMDPSSEEAARILAREIVSGKLVLKDWDHSVEQWFLRVNFVAKFCRESGFPPIGEDDRLHLIEQICNGVFSYREAKDRPVKSLVHSWLSPVQKAQLDRLAPERLELPNGKRAKVTYQEDGDPFIALKIQDLFGVKKTPAVAAGKVPLRVEILTPNMRPVQVTKDLENFWKEHYPKIRQEFQRKYPKHSWPE